MDLSNIEYIVYDGYDSICDALTTISNVYTNSAYGGLFFTSAVIGIFLGLLIYFLKKFEGAYASPVTMVVPILAGLIIYHSMFLPKTKITVYDKSTGLFQTFNDIPLGIGVMAGIINKIENGIIDIFDTSSLYKDSAGGRGIEALMMLYSEASTLNPYIDQSLDEYIEDCVAFELGRPGSSMNFGKLRDGTEDFMTFFAKAQNPAVFTITYLGPGGSGTVNGNAVSCTEAWNRISGAITTGPGSDVDKRIRNACMSAGYFADGGNLSFQACKDMLSRHIAFLKDASISYGGGTYDLDSFTTKLYFTRRIDYFAREGQVSPYGNYNIGIQTVSTSAMLNQWIPYIKAVLTALVFSITPLLMIFLPTPLFGRVISLIFGFFLWLAFWSVSDAVVHNSMGTMMQNYFETFRNRIATGGDIGYESLLTMTAPAAKTLAVLGYVRAGAVSLATVMTSMLVKFGSHTLARFAGGLTGSVASAGAEAGRKTLHAIDSASTIQSATNAAATYQWAGSHDFEKRRFAALGAMRDATLRGGALHNIQKTTPWNKIQSSYEYQGRMGIETGQRMIEKVGEGSPEKAASQMADMTSGKQIGELKTYIDRSFQSGKPLGEVVEGVSKRATEQNLTLADARQALAERLVSRGDATDTLDAYRKMGTAMLGRQAGSLVEAYHGDTESMMKDLVTADRARRGDIKAQREASMALFGDASDESVARTMQYIRSGEYMNEAAKFKEIQDIARRGGISDKWTAFLAHQRTRVEMSFNEAQAKRFFGHDAPAGVYRISRDTDGNIIATHGEGGFSANITSGITKKMTLNPKNPEDRKVMDGLVRDLESAGNRNAALALRASIVSGRPATITMYQPKEGEGIGSAVITSGARSETVDFSSSQKGYRHMQEAFESVKRGREVQDINTVSVDHGTKIGDTALQMGLRMDPALYRQMVKAWDQNNLPDVDAEISQTSSKLMAGLRPYVEQSGKNAHKAVGYAYAELGLKTPFGGGGAEGRLQISSDKTTNVNLLTKALDDIQHRALKEGAKLGYEGKQLEAHVAAKTAQFLNAWKEFATKDQEFGAAKPGEMASQAKDAVINAGKEVLDSAVPYPLASEKEQERRKGTLQKEMEKYKSD